MPPNRFLDLRQIIALADDAAGITDMELRARLVALAWCAR